MSDIKEKLDELHAWRERLLREIQERDEELARLDFAISVLRGPNSAQGSVKLVLTPEGKIRDLAGAIRRTLEDGGVINTASGIRDALYNSELKMAPEQLRRRISVKTSAMNKKRTGNPVLIDSGFKSAYREIYWALPEWVDENGRVQDERISHEALWPDE